MKKRQVLLLVTIALAATATGCCEWARKHCPPPQPAPLGPVIRLGIQGGSGLWTTNYDPVSFSEMTTLRDDFIGVATNYMVCSTGNEKVDAYRIRLTTERLTVEIVRSTSKTMTQPHWIVQERNGRIYELLPRGSSGGPLPAVLQSPTRIEVEVNGAFTECNNLELQVWRFQ